jgi:hypothetical protein
MFDHLLMESRSSLPQSVFSTYVLKSNGNVWGTYSLNTFISQALQAGPPLTGQIAQGALVDTPAGNVSCMLCLASEFCLSCFQWYWMGFSSSYPNGRYV